VKDLPQDENYLSNGMFIFDRVYTCIEHNETLMSEQAFKETVSANFTSLNNFFSELLQQTELLEDNLEANLKTFYFFANYMSQYSFAAMEFSQRQQNCQFVRHFGRIRDFVEKDGLRLDELHFQNYISIFCFLICNVVSQKQHQIELLSTTDLIVILRDFIDYEEKREIIF